MSYTKHILYVPNTTKYYAQRTKLYIPNTTHLIDTLYNLIHT